MKYFSTKHIQIVTHKDLLGKASKSLNYGERTYQMISLLKNDFIDELYERLYVFKDFNILFQSDIIEILADFPFNINPNYFNNFIINDDSIINKISKSEYDKKKFELVTKTLSKAGYDGFYSMEDKNNKIIVKFDDQVKKDELFDLYTDFKYTEVLKKIKELNPKSISVLRKKAFYLLKLEKNKKALTTYNMISKKLSNSADFSQFILNEMSRKIVNQILQFYCFNEKKYWEEARNINVEKYINNLPLRERSNALRFYKIINNIFHKYYSRLLKIRNELEGDKILLERGGWTNNDHHSSIQRIADELILYVFKNHLPFDFYSEIKSVFYYYFDSVMLSYTTKVNKATENQLNQKASKIYSLDYNPIFIAIYYIKTSDLVDLLKKYKPDFPIILENIKPIELINKFSNLIEFLYTNRFEKTNWDKSVLIENLLKRCNNFIILLSNCDLTSEDYRRFFNNIIKLNKKISLLHIRNYLIPFMETIVKVNHNKMLDFDLLINSILLKFNFIHFKRCKKDMRKFFELVHEIAPVYHSRKYKSLSKLLEHIDSNQDDKEMAVILYNLIDGYNIFGKGLRIQFRKVLSNINQILLEEDYNLYVVILFEKIVDYQVYNKSTLLSLLPNWFEYCKKSIISQSQKGDQSNDIEFILDFLYKLKMNLNHKHHNLFKENFSYIERSVPFYDYFLFDRKIKKELFKGIWLLHLLKDPNPINRFKIIMKDLGLNSALMKIKVYESLTGQINDKQHKALIQVLQLLDKLDYN
ncbi:MAG: hypothetical protein P9L97_03545 [Candidatus Tenebribacter davisii]|nr:hypothetical protein [Candidatus Tenebribacter davisii]